MDIRPSEDEQEIRPAQSSIGGPERVEWRSTFLGVAARTAVADYFLRCLRYAEAGMTDEAVKCLTSRRWREGIDFTGVPTEVLDRTEAMCRRGQTSGPDQLPAIVLDVLDIWY